MKKFLIKTSMLIAICLLTATSYAETLTWVNPTMYVDSTAIAAADLPKIITHIYYKPTTSTTYTWIAAITSGGQQWVGTLPKTIKCDVEYNYTVATELNKIVSAKAIPSNYTVACVATQPSTDVLMKK
jgi:hypothetical protein